MRVLVCGGRTFGDEDNFAQWQFGMSVLDDLLDPEDTVIISGCADGADSIGEDWAITRMDGRNLDRYPAEWDKYGKSAGFKRNVQMLQEGKPDLVIAFPGGKGTAMMVRLAREVGVEVKEINYYGDN